MNVEALTVSRAESAKDTRRRLILEATKALMREGEVVSSATIAKRAGVSVATVYNLVGKREVLIGKILDELLVRLGDQIRNFDDPDPILRAEAVVTISIDMFVEDAAVYRQIVHELSGSLAKAVSRQVSFEPVTLQIDAMAEAQRMRKIAAWVDPAVAGQAILTSYVGAMHTWSGSGSAEAFRRQALAGFWTAIAAYGTKPEREKAIERLAEF